MWKISKISFEKSVGAVIYRKEGKNFLFLLVRYRSWQWDFPKGHIEKGETEQQTMRREIKEETKITDLRILPNFKVSSRYFYVAKGNEKKERLLQGKGIYIFKKAVYFAAKTEQNEVVIDFENKDFSWLDLRDALKRLGNDDSRRILKMVYGRLQKQK